MDRKSLREYTHRAANSLIISNNLYKQWVFRYTFLELEKDLGTKGDITTNVIFHKNRLATGRVIAKEDGVFAGREEIQYFLVDSDPAFRPGIKGKIELKFHVSDGANFKSGDLLFEISADVHDLLAVERTVLNLVMRMSAIATLTRKMINLLDQHHCDVLITPTRKTLWGLIDKKAVVIGGGGTHRLNLADAILVKDTHLDLVNRDFGVVLQNIADANVECRFVEIEVESIEETISVCRAFHEFLGTKIAAVGAVLLDNMTAEQTKYALDAVKSAGLYENILFEASGGITERNVLNYAKSGVDIISMGCLTSGIKGIDMSLKIRVE